MTYEMLRPTLLLLENEDDEFLDEFNRVIKDSNLANQRPNEYGVEDLYLEKELGIGRNDERLHHARVKRRAVDEVEAKLEAQAMIIA